MERLTEYHCNVAVIKDKSKLSEAMEKLSKYEDLEEQGLLLRLPCKVGEWVYSAECGMVVPYIVASYTNDKYGLWCLNLHGGLIGLWGKTVFLNKAEAEEALKKMESEHE